MGLNPGYLLKPFLIYIQFFSNVLSFFSFIIQAIVINGKLENDISGCLKYPESIAKKMPPEQLRTDLDLGPLGRWTQNDLCDATQPK